LADKIAKTLIEEHLAACVNVIPGLTSYYQWKGELFAEHEVQLVIKTSEVHCSEIEHRFKELHPYELPEFLVVAVRGGSDAYLKWVRGETQK